MVTSGHSITRVSIEVLRFSAFLQLLFVLACGAQVPLHRKFLHAEARGLIHVDNQHGHNIGWQYSLLSKIMLMAVPGMVICGCVFPCFWRTKENPEESLDGDLHPIESSFGTGTSNERSQGTHMRYPQSPMRFPPPSPRFSPRPNPLASVNLNFSQVVKATQNFSTSSCIGEGGYGTVYKGRLPDGQEVAIKRARKELQKVGVLHSVGSVVSISQARGFIGHNLLVYWNRGMDHFDSAEFNREVEILSKIEHHSLVRLLGCVDKGNERLIVTEYVSNGTLRQHLDGEHGKILDFAQRLQIAIDVAHGLTYLHTYAERQIIHRDVKSSNILLTDGMRAKVADFGFARAGPQDPDRTHISTKVKGTVGYLDPEYMRTYQLTPKSDVYSFGILLLEILTGRRPVDPKRPPDERVLIKWVFYNYSEGNVAGLVDPQMQDFVNAEILKKMFGLAIICAAPVRADRPDMKDVGERLWAIRVEYKRHKG